MRTELYVNGTRLDLQTEVSTAITYAIADIKNPDKRVGSYSKTVVLPGTKVVNDLFGHIFEVNLEIQNSSTTNFNPDFNPNLKADFVVYCDTIEQFRGYMRLRKVTRERVNLDKITYEVELYGELANIIQALGDAKMEDLDISEYNHTYDRATQLATWSTVNASGGYVYPMIQYGLNNGITWDVEHFYPAVFAKVLFDKVMNYAGYVYDSSFLTSAPFNKLIVPYTGDRFKLTQADVNNRLFEANKNTSYTSGTITAPASDTINPVIFNNEVSDVSNQYNPVTGEFTANYGGNYEFVIGGAFFFTAVTTLSNPGNAAGLSVSVLVNGVVQASTTVPNNFTSLTAGNSTPTIMFTWSSPTIRLESGDIVTVKFIAQAGTGTGTYTWTLNSGASFKNTINDPQVYEGDTAPMNALLPRDVRQADFFLHIVKMFNLMVEPDRAQPNKLYIEPASDFYGSGTVRNWTKKLDTSRPFEILPMGALDARRYTLKWKDADDYYNKLYREKWGETYGQKNHDVNNDFLKDVNVYESIFSPTPIVNTGADDRIIPYIYVLDGNNVPKQTTAGVRILYWGGEVATSYQWNYTDNSNSLTKSTYPYAGHLDSVSSPTFDLNFTNPRELYYITQTYTDGNLWNRYHKQFIEEITDSNSKIVTGFFYLKPVDILNLSFRDTIYIDGTYYRLQRVIDYDPSKEQVTKVELLKIKNAPTFAPTSFSIANYFGGLTPIVVGGQSRPRAAEGSSINAGLGNQVNESNIGVAVIGRNNNIGTGAERITILSSSGVTVAPYLTNVTVINTNDVNVTRSGEVWINGSRYSQGANNAYTVTTSQTITGAGIYYCTGTLTLTLSTSVLSAQDEIQIFNMGTGTLTIAGGGINILQSPGTSSATITSTQQYDSITLRYNGTNYIIQ